VSKASLRLDAYGTVDELNAHMGVLADTMLQAPKLDALHAAIVREMNGLFALGSFLATPDESRDTYNQSPPAKEVVTRLEAEIDAWDAGLPELKNFILPTGHSLVSRAHVVRTVARRAERKLVLFHDDVGGSLELQGCIQYLNRLSDWLFVLSRYVGHQMNIPEVVWKPDGSK
jgi:cob(I)alamin adenosyltransferase